MDYVNLKAQYRALQHSIDARLRTVLEHGQFIMGPEVAELEAELARYTGGGYAIGCASGTDALLIALMALHVGPGDEVITTPFTFAATAETIALAGATPVFVDIDPATYNIDPGRIAAAITRRTKAILPVSLYGQCADMDAIHAAAGGIPVIEDAAQSFGATYRGRRSCNLSVIACTSFFPSKPLGCYGDGGACFTSDEALAADMRQIRDHGQDRRYHHRLIGVNGRLDTMQAAVLLAKLEVFEQELAARRRAAAWYGELLEGIVDAPRIAEGNSSVYAQYTIEVEARDRVQAAMKERGVPTAVHYPVVLNRQPAFAALCRVVGTLDHAERAAARVLSLPLHPYLTREEAGQVAQALQAVIGVPA